MEILSTRTIQHCRHRLGIFNTDSIRFGSSGGSKLLARAAEEFERFFHRRIFGSLQYRELTPSAFKIDFAGPPPFNR